MLTSYGRKIIRDARTQILLRKIEVDLYTYGGTKDCHGDNPVAMDCANGNCRACADGALLMAKSLDDTSLQWHSLHSQGIIDRLGDDVGRDNLAYIEMASMIWDGLNKDSNNSPSSSMFCIANKVWSETQHEHAVAVCTEWARAMRERCDDRSQLAIVINVYNNALRNGCFDPLDYRFTRPRDFHRFLPKMATPLAVPNTPATFAAGQRYSNRSSTYIVGRVGPDDYCLINLETGNRFTERVTIEDDNKMFLSTLVGESTGHWKLVNKGE